MADDGTFSLTGSDFIEVPDDYEWHFIVKVFNGRNYVVWVDGEKT